MSAQGWYDQHGTFHEGPPPTPQAPAPAPAATGWYDQNGTFHEGTPPGLVPARKNTGLIALLSTLSVLLVVTWAAIAWALITGFSLADTSAPPAAEEEASATQTVDVALAPAAAVGANAFTAAAWASKTASTLALDATGSASPAADPAPVTAVPGDTDGLYTLPLGSSFVSGDAPSLFAELSVDPARSEAFVEALNSDSTLNWGQPLAAVDLEAFLRQLSYVSLSHDTWVTHYALADGALQPTQAVLQKGTGVLVDRFGVPRVRTQSGDPLTQSEYSEGVGVSAAIGESWPDFNPADVVVVEPASNVLDAFTIATDSEPADMAATPCRGVGLGASCDPPGPTAVIATAPEVPANLVTPQVTNCTPQAELGSQVDFRWLNNSGETLYMHFVDPTTCTVIGSGNNGHPDGYATGWSVDAGRGIDPQFLIISNVDGVVAAEMLIKNEAVVVR